MALKYCVTRCQQETKIFLITKALTWKFDPCFWMLRKDRNGIREPNNQKSRNHSWNHLYIKLSLKLLVIFFLRSFFFTDHLKHKTVNKTTCRMPSAVPHRWSNHRRCSVKKVFLEFSQNSQKNACARVSFFLKLQALEKRLWHRFF